MKSGMTAAEAIFDALGDDSPPREIEDYRFRLSGSPDLMESGGAGGPGNGARDRREGWLHPMEPGDRSRQAAFGNVSLTVLTLSTTTSLSSVPVSR